MHKFATLVVTMGMGMLFLPSVTPLAAQVDNSDAYSVDFTAPFPFYAGNVKLSAGSYVITEPNASDSIVLIRNIADTKGDFLHFTPTSSLDPHNNTDVTFQKIGNTGYLRTLSVKGATDGLTFPRTKAEAEAETTAENTNGNTTAVELASLDSCN